MMNQMFKMFFDVVWNITVGMGANSNPGTEAACSGNDGNNQMCHN